MLGVNPRPKALTAILPPVLAATQKSLAVSSWLAFSNIFLVLSNNFVKLNKAFPPVTIFLPVLAISAASETGFIPPCNAAAPASITSSIAIDASIPNVYAELAPRLFKNAPAPPLVEVVIAIISSNSVAASTSGSR